MSRRLNYRLLFILLLIAVSATVEILREHRPSFRYQDDVRVGAVLPPDGIEYWDVPPEYGVRGYRYTVINDRTVLVDPRTHRIVQVIE